ncbi:MAG: sugar phosphate nucleotidyltransferase [Limisphaerales bacterium]
MDIKKAVITAAGPQQAALPLQSLVDQDGSERTALEILLNESRRAGVEEACVVIRPGDADAYRKAAGQWGQHVRLIEQAEPRGYGHAVWSAHTFTEDSPFLLMVSDHLYVSEGNDGCAKELVNIASAENCSVSAVQATHESKLPYYGAAGGHRIPNRANLYQIERLLEKPTPTEAEQSLIVPGLRAGHYLCFFGLHVLTPAVMQLLNAQIKESDPSENIHLTPALNTLAAQERYLATELHGRRYDIGVKYGLLNAQLAIALEGKDREEVLTGLVELLAARQR